MKKFLLLVFIFGFGFAQTAMAQVPAEVDIMDDDVEVEVDSEESDDDDDAPLDDIVDRTHFEEHRILAYENVREADLFWEKRLWRVIDVREKMNKPFVYPEAPLYNIIDAALKSGEVTAYSGDSDKFEYKLSLEEYGNIGGSIDTITIIDPETYEPTYKVVANPLNWEDVKRYRMKEMWYFDSKISRLKVRILGIAPVLDNLDENGNFRGEQVLYWLYYPDCREMFAKHKVFIEGNDASSVTWEDLFEMRYFASNIFKESNVHDRRLKDYLDGVDLLLEAQKIKDELFNFEHDLWSY